MLFFFFFYSFFSFVFPFIFLFSFVFLNILFFNFFCELVGTESVKRITTGEKKPSYGDYKMTKK